MTEFPKVDKEEWAILMSKLERGQGGGKQVPKLSAREAQWLRQYILACGEFISKSALR